MRQRYVEEIRGYRPQSDQQRADQQTILWYIGAFPETVLLRRNAIAHITSSGFLVNSALDRVLMAHHNIRDTWAWSGGHADGDGDLLAVAIREAREETGVSQALPLSRHIASLDILPVFGHYKRGAYVNAHLHLNVTYILVCDEAEEVHSRPEENSGVRWFAAEEIASPLFSQADVRLYAKLLEWARQHQP